MDDSIYDDIQANAGGERNYDNLEHGPGLPQRLQNEPTAADKPSTLTIILHRKVLKRIAITIILLVIGMALGIILQKYAITKNAGNACVNVNTQQTTTKSTTAQPMATQVTAKDCQDYANISRIDGVYKVNIERFGETDVFCKFDNINHLGWTVFQQRVDRLLNFQQPWDVYKAGFGIPGEGKNFWLGNEALHYLTTQKTYILRVELVDNQNTQVYAEFASVFIESDDAFYRINVGAFTRGPAGDGHIFHTIGGINGMYFSTYDQDHDSDGVNCAIVYGGGWWFNQCYYSCLNRNYHLTGAFSYDNQISWYTHQTILRQTRMMVGPTRA